MLVRVSGFLVGCVLGAAAMWVGASLPNGTFDVTLRLLVLVGLPQLAAVVVARAIARHSAPVAAAAGIGAAWAAGIGAIVTVAAMRPVHAHDGPCGLVVLTVVIAIVMGAVGNAGLALVSTVLAIGLRRP